MRLECHILSHPVPCNPKAIGKVAKGFVCIGKGKLKPSNGTFHLKISTAKAKNQPAIDLGAQNITQFITRHVAEGKVSIQFKSPAIQLFISQADANKLRRFVQIVNRICNGENVNLNEVEKVKSTDFQQQKSLILRESKTYRSDYAKSFPTSIIDLALVKCNLVRFDVRWFGCANLVRIDLSDNRIGSIPAEMNKIKLLKNLTRLKSLDLSHNEIQSIPDLNDFPASLLELNLSHNSLTSVPAMVCRARSLVKLNIANNPITALPEEWCWPRLRELNFSSTCVSVCPYYFTKRSILSLDSLSCSDLQIDQSVVDAVGLVVRSDSPSSLESLALAAVASCKQKIPEEYIPWPVRMMRRELIVKCSICLRFRARSDCSSEIRSVNPMTIANQVVTNRDLLVLLYKCSPCCYNYIPLPTPPVLNWRRDWHGGQ